MTISLPLTTSTLFACIHTHTQTDTHTHTQTHACTQWCPAAVQIKTLKWSPQYATFMEVLYRPCAEATSSPSRRAPSSSVMNKKTKKKSWGRGGRKSPRRRESERERDSEESEMVGRWRGRSSTVTVSGRVFCFRVTELHRISSIH